MKFTVTLYVTGEKEVIPEEWKSLVKRTLEQIPGVHMAEVEEEFEAPVEPEHIGGSGDQ